MTKKIFDMGGVKFSVNKKGDEVKISMGKEIRYVKTLELWGMAFNFTKDEELKSKMMPLRQENMMKFKKVHTVQLKHDMKAGETLQFSCLIDVPTHIVAGMKDMLEREVPGAVEALKDMIPELSPTEPLLPKS